MLRSAIRGSTGSGPPQQNVSEIIHLLQSNNVSVIEETTSLVRDSFAATSDSWLLNGLVEYYVTSGNVVIRKLITGVRPPHHKHLLAKLDDYLQKPATRYVALNLFGHVVRKEPSWIHNIVQSRAFATVIKCLQLDNDIAALTLAMYVVSTLMPKVPTHVTRHLNHLFGIYVRLVSWKTVRGTGSSELNVANFDIALLSLFLCLYDMYPCRFLEYLQLYYGKTKVGSTKATDTQNIQIPASTPGEEQILMERKRHEIFKANVAPMMKQVRLNPNLILYTKDLEVLSEKWRKFESYDIVAEISRISIESKEEMPVADGAAFQLPQVSSSQSVTESSSTSAHRINIGGALSASELDTEIMAIWSPSMEIGLSTPPVSRGITPTCEISEDKTQLSSTEKPTAKLKFRPESLALPHGPLRGSSPSTPCTPTLPSLSFEYERSEGFASSEDAANVPPCPGKISEVPCSRSNSKTDLDLLTSIATDQNPPPSSPGGPSPITDFSPALQPSADHPCVLQSTENTPNTDALFITNEKPTVKDILGLNDANSVKKLSSSELLRKEMQYSLQTDSQKVGSDIDWLHFGQGSLSEKDSKSVLAGYLQMRCALEYERHLRQQHEIRSRRLMRMVYELSADEERNKALKDTLAQKEKEVVQLQEQAKTMRSDFVSHERAHQSSEELLKKQSSQLASTLKSTREENFKLKLEKAKDMADLKKAVDSEKECQAQLYKCKLQLETEARNKETNQELRAQVFQLQKEMLVVEELSRKMNELQENEWKFKISKTAEHEMLVQSYKTETEKLKNDLTRVSAVRDAMAGKAKEMEKMVEKKKRLLEEQKRYLETVKSLARSQIQAIESKYQAQKAASMQMEVKMMELFSRLTALEGRSSETVSRSQNKPIEQLPSNAQYRRYGDLQKVSPEFSPPMKVGMMEEETVATSELEANTGTEE